MSDKIINKNETMNIFKIVATLIIVLFILSIVLGFFGFGFGMMGGMMGGMMMMMGGFEMLFPVILIGLVFYFIFRNSENTDKDGFLKGENEALDDLDKRYAKGEISRDSYLLIKKDILRTHR